MPEPQADVNLSMFDRIENPLEAIDKMGEWFARSGMFRCSKLEQGKVLALACMVERRNPLEIMREYHVMEDGTLAMRADAIQAKFEADGGSVEWICSNIEVCEAIYSHPKARNPVTIKVTLQELKDSGVAINAKGELKANYRRSGRQMLRARNISEGVRMIRPGIIVGIVTPEEISDDAISGNGWVENPAKITLTPAQGTVVADTKSPTAETKVIVPETKTAVSETKPSVSETTKLVPSTSSVHDFSKPPETKPASKKSGIYDFSKPPEPPAYVTEAKNGYKKSKAQEKADREKAEKEALSKATKVAQGVTETAEVEAIAKAAEAAQAKSEKVEKSETLADPAPDPAAGIIPEELPRDTEIEVLEALFKGKEFEVNKWLVEANWIAPLGSWRGLRPDQRKKILAKPEAFMRAVIQKNQATGTTVETKA